MVGQYVPVEFVHSRRSPARSVAILLVAAALSSCSATPTAASLSPSPSPTGTLTPSAEVAPTPEAKTAAELKAVAQVFNDDYGRNDDGPVYDRWDAASQAIITRSEYVRRHQECPTAPQGQARVESATPGADGMWLVRYEIDGSQFTDYWHYVDGRWVFDLLRSNPHAAKLYRLPSAEYVAAIGCAGR